MSGDVSVLLSLVCAKHYAHVSQICLAMWQHFSLWNLPQLGEGSFHSIPSGILGVELLPVCDVKTPVVLTVSTCLI